jgi:DNA/RNA-binding domain of Phe-tRNA-synthetase-like protein
LIAADPVLAGFRALHQAFEVPTRKLFSAPETLIRYVEKRGDIPRIGPLVDLYNAVSLKTGLALGAHDIDRIDGNISLRLTTGSERFHPVGAMDPEPIRPGEYAYVDDGNEVICRLEVRQVEKTKVTSSTTDVFLIVQGNPATSARQIETGHDFLITVLRRFLGGNAVPLHRP